MCTMAQVLDRFGDGYSSQYDWSPEQAKVVNCIRACRTEKLGGYQLRCEHCGVLPTRYCSCRNRHCPICQRQASQQWQKCQRQRLLPTPYFHLVFTLPHDLNGWIKLHPEVLYRLLFKAVWGTLKCFGEDPKRLNGQVGVTAVLHTWGQTLDQHVHLHCLVPAGAWSETEGKWHASGSEYLFPVKALSRFFRGKMVSLLREAYQQKELTRVTRPKEVDTLLRAVMKKDWVVYTKTCHGNPERVVDYLSEYTHRIAINDSRLLDIVGDQVKFRWKDYRDGQRKVMFLSGVEFIRRFLQHVLPKGFMRIRHYGFLSNRWRALKLKTIRESLNCPEEVKAETTPTETSPCVLYCPKCKSPAVTIVDWIIPMRRQRE